MENKEIGRKIRHLARVIKKTADAECMNQINIGLTTMEGMAVFHIGHLGGQAQTQDILSTLRISKSTLSELLSSLEKKGYLVYARVSSDKRKKNIVLTEKGQDHIERAKKIFTEFEGKITEGLDEKDLEAFERVYQKILANIGEESL